MAGGRRAAAAVTDNPIIVGAPIVAAAKAADSNSAAPASATATATAIEVPIAATIATRPVGADDLGCKSRRGRRGGNVHAAPRSHNDNAVRAVAATYARVGDGSHRRVGRRGDGWTTPARAGCRRWACHAHRQP